MKTLKIDSVSQDKKDYGVKITLQVGKEKYSFYATKKDGSETKAYQQFKKYRFGIGDSVNAEVAEEAKSFTNKEGKLVNYTQRTILYFEEVEGVPTKPMNVPAPMPKDPPKADLSDIKRLVIAAIEDVFDKIAPNPKGLESALSVEDEQTSEADLPF